MKKILIALDYEPSAEKIAETGHALAVGLQAEMVLLHVIAEPAYYSSLAYSPIMGFGGFVDNFNMGIDADIQHDIKEQTQVFLDQSKTHLGSGNISTLIVEGDFAESIVKAAVEIQADLIIMGSHSRRGLDKLLMENVAEKVLHLSTVPILIIPIKDLS